MSVPFQGFTGPSYQFTNKYAAIERTVNYYLTANESMEEKGFKLALEPSPGNKQFSALPVPAPFNQRCRGLYEYRGQVIGVNGNVAYTLNQIGEMAKIGDVLDDGHPVSIAANANNQVGIASGQNFLYVYNVATGEFKTVSTNADGSGFQGASMITFQDGYILAIPVASNIYQVSGTDAIPVGDMTQWDAANVNVLAGQQDYVRAIISSREYVRLLGQRRSQVHVASPTGFPFQSYNDTFIETGIEAPFSLVDTGESLIWTGQNKNGAVICYEDAGFSPRRISTFAVEQQWKTYQRRDDAVAFIYRWNGHLIYRITFIIADKTWEYDKTVSMLLGRHIWCERNFTDYQGIQHARPEHFSCCAFGGETLVGSTGVDGNPGAVYVMADDAKTDCAVDGTGAQIQTEIVRDRIAPHIVEGYRRIIYNRIAFLLARGTGLDGAPVTGTNPMLLLRWSDDGGNTWGAEHQIPVGKIGEFLKLVYYNRLGYSRDRVFWVRCTDPTYWGLLGAKLDMQVCGS